MDWLVRFRSVDRRVINTLVVLVLAFPILVRFPLPMVPFNETKKLKEYVDSLAPGKLVVIACDWEAGTKGECEPLTAAMIDYLFRRGQPFAIFSLVPQGTELGQGVAERLAVKHRKQYGVDWINWGYRPQVVTTLIAMMNDVPGLLKKDIRDVDLTTYPMMKGVKSLRDVGLIYEVTGTSLVEAYVQFCAGVPLAEGCTAVMGPEMYPYMQSGQMKGLLVGLGGAAQFETVTDFRDEEGQLGGQGLRGMGSQSLGHLLVMVLIVLGNLGLWAERRLQSERPIGRAESGEES